MELGWLSFEAGLAEAGLAEAGLAEAGSVAPEFAVAARFPDLKSLPEALLWSMRTSTALWEALWGPYSSGSQPVSRRNNKDWVQGCLRRYNARPWAYSLRRQI